MSLPTTEQLEELGTAQPKLAISAYVPFDNESPDAIETNRIRVKNLISDIEDVLKDNKNKIDSPTKKILKPLQNLLEDPDQLWQRNIRSFAVFVDESQLKYFFLPMSQPEPVFQIQESFYLDPLVAANDDPQTYYALSLSHEHLQLYKFNPYDIEPVEVPGLPSGGMEEVLNIDEYPDAHQFHGESPRATQDEGNAAGTSQHHGQYEPNDVDKDLLKQYFRQLDGPLSTYMQQTDAPLVLAGVNWLFPIFKQCTSLQNLHSKTLDGNYQHVNQDELHSKLINLLEINPDETS